MTTVKNFNSKNFTSKKSTDIQDILDAGVIMIDGIFYYVWEYEKVIYISLFITNNKKSGTINIGFIERVNGWKFSINKKTGGVEIVSFQHVKYPANKSLRY